MLRRDPRAEARGLLGLARRAGALVHGIDAVRRGLNAGEIELVILAEDAAAGQIRKVLGVLRHRSVDTRWVDGQIWLGEALGSAGVSAVGITHRSFADSLLRVLPAGRREAGQPEEEPGLDAGR
jgi:ribosomal protein L7Ae-like RNA K-turn-binding protein